MPFSGDKQPIPAPINQPLVRGNIDLSNRPIVRNPDGSISTVRSISIGTDQGTVLIPTVTNDGRVVSNDAAIDLFHKTGKHLGIFPDEQSADNYAQQLHADQARLYDPQENIQRLKNSILMDMVNAKHPR